MKQTCADNLARLTEMLAAASQYANLCDANVSDECVIDVQSAQEQMYSVRVSHAELSLKLNDLEQRLDARLKELVG